MRLQNSLSISLEHLSSLHISATGAYVSVDQHAIRAPDSYLVRVVAKTRKVAMLAKTQVEHALSDGGGDDAIIELFIPEQAYGKLIGEKGSTIRSMMAGKFCKSTHNRHISSARRCTYKSHFRLCCAPLVSTLHFQRVRRKFKCVVPHLKRRTSVW
jgi:hypothetical protein